jgi:hypothetical protein
MEAQKKLDECVRKETKKEELLSQIEMGAVSNDRTTRKRVKILSTPIGGGDMFTGETELFQPTAPLRKSRVKTMSTPISGDMWDDTTTVVLGPGEMLINIIGPNDEKFPAKMKEETFKHLSDGGTPSTLVAAGESTQFIGQYLDGFVRRRERGSKTKSFSEGVHSMQNQEGKKSLFASFVSTFSKKEKDTIHPSAL